MLEMFYHADGIDTLQKHLLKSAKSAKRHHSHMFKIIHLKKEHLLDVTGIFLLIKLQMNRRMEHTASHH